MKHVIFNPDADMYYYHSTQRGMIYTKNKNDSVVFNSKEDAEQVVITIHSEREKNKLKTLNLICIPF